MSKPDTAPYKGVRDFYPDDMRFQKWLFGKWRSVVEKFGYVEYGASILEPSELYKAKTSEEIVSEQTYTFTDRGDREVTLRPEMTPTVTRMVAAKRRELGFPVRWYSIQNIFRYESPQRGRLREHWQLNVDMFGVAETPADVEIITIAYELLKSLGAKDEDFQFRLNSREIIDSHLLKQGVDKDKIAEVRRLIDKKDKLENFDERLENAVGHKINLDMETDDKVKSIIGSLKSAGINNVVFDPGLTRGFDYYTSTVFEVFDTNPDNRRSLFGGGRYDDLVALFTEENVPAVGFAMGDVTAQDFLQTHGLLPKLSSETDLALLSVGKSGLNKIAHNLRGQGINVATDWTDRKIGDKIRHAEKNGIRFIIAVGEEEMKSGEYRIKNIESGDEKILKLQDIASFIRNS